jgi:hypothetical protein
LSLSNRAAQSIGDRLVTYHRQKGSLTKGSKFTNEPLPFRESKSE